MIAMVFNCTKNEVTVVIEVVIIFDLMLLFAISPVASSQFHCTCPLAPRVLMVSKLLRLSIKIPFFIAEASNVLLIAF